MARPQVQRSEQSPEQIPAERMFLGKSFCNMQS